MTFLIAVLAALQDPSEAAVRDACLKIEKALNARDPAPLDAALDFDAFFERVYTGVEAKDAVKTGFKSGVRKTFSLSKNVVVTLGDAGTAKLLRVRAIEGGVGAVFRILNADRFNYFEYRFEAAPRGGVRIVDSHVFLHGEWISAMTRRIFLATLLNQAAATVKGPGVDADYVKGLQQLQVMQKLSLDGKPEEALREFARLPAPLRREKCALVLRTLVAMDVSEEEWGRGVDDLKKQFPGDPCIPMHSLGLLTLQKKYPEALQAIEDLDRFVGGDAYLHVQRAQVHLEAGNLEKAKAATLKGIEAEKDLSDAHWTLVAISLKEKNFAETARLLASIEKELGEEIVDLKELPDYAEFVKSPQYPVWLKSRKK